MRIPALISALSLLAGAALGAQQAAWKSISPRPASVETIAMVDTDSARTLFIESNGGEIRRSTDNGATWTAAGKGGSFLAADPTDPRIVYATMFPAASVQKTTDGGETWVSVLRRPGFVPDCIAIDPARPGTVYVTYIQGGIWKTDDAGATWRLSRGANTGFARDIAISPRDSTVYFATTGGIFKSEDRGGSWTQILADHFVVSLAIDPSNDRVVYAGTDSDVIFRTEDGGATWTSLAALPFPMVFSLAIDPENPRLLYAGTANGGVFRSSTRGSDWSATGLSKGMIFSLKAAADGVLYAGTDFAAALVSRDWGDTWESLDPSLLSGCNCQNGYTLTVNPSNPEHLLLSTLEGSLWTSTDGGETWSTAGRGFTSREARLIVFDTKNPEIIYAGSYYGGGVFKSTDGGQT